MAGCSAPCATNTTSTVPAPSPSETKKSCPLPEAPNIFAPPCLETRPYKACPTSSKARQIEGGDSAAGKSGSDKAFRNKMLSILNSMREPLADHQASQGLPKHEQYTFVELIKNLCTHSYDAVLAIFTMLYNLLPFLNGFLYLLRFILDKLIEICKCEKKSEVILYSLMFLVEMGVIVTFIVIMASFIIIPVWNLTYSLLSKLSIL